MAITTDQYTIKALFDHKEVFVVPKYQRGYAWDDEAVDEFIHDILECVIAPAQRFFEAPFFWWDRDYPPKCSAFDPWILRGDRWPAETGVLRVARGMYCQAYLSDDYGP